MLRTTLACAAVALAGWLAASWATDGFQAWTSESARRLEVARSPVRVPAVRVEGPGVAAGPLTALLADGRNATVVEFVYTNCRTACLALGSTFQRMQRALLAADPPSRRVSLLSISFDPARDDLATLRDYSERLGAVPPLWRFVRVPSGTELATLLRAMRVVVVPDGRDDFEHNAALLVVDPDGRLVRVLDAGERETALAYAVSLARGGGP